MKKATFFKVRFSSNHLYNHGIVFLLWGSEFSTHSSGGRNVRLIVCLFAHRHKISVVQIKKRKKRMKNLIVRKFLPLEKILQL